MVSYICMIIALTNFIVALNNVVERQKKCQMQQCDNKCINVLFIGGVMKMQYKKSAYRSHSGTERRYLADSDKNFISGKKFACK